MLVNFEVQIAFSASGFAVEPPPSLRQVKKQKLCASWTGCKGWMLPIHEFVGDLPVFCCTNSTFGSKKISFSLTRLDLMFPQNLRIDHHPLAQIKGHNLGYSSSPGVQGATAGGSSTKGGWCLYMKKTQFLWFLILSINWYLLLSHLSICFIVLYIYIWYMSIRQNYQHLKVVEPSQEPSRPIGDDPAPIPLDPNKFPQ